MFGHAFGVDIGDGELRIVGLHATGLRRTLTYAARIPLSADATPDDVAAVLAARLREAGAGRRRVAVALPSSGCSVKVADLPPGKPAELAQVARFEAETQFPLPLSELVWGYALGPVSAGQRHAVIAGVRRALVDERLALLQQAGAMPALFLPASLAAAGAIDLPATPCILLLVDRAWCDLCLYTEGRLRACRSVLAGQPEADGWAARIARELHPWVVGHEDVRQIVVLGTATSEVVEALTQATGLPVTPGDPWQGVEIPPDFTRSLEAPSSSFATAIGLAIAVLASSASMNLLPVPVIEARVQRRTLARTFCLLLIILALLGRAFVTLRQQAQARQITAEQVRAQVRQEKRAMGPLPSPGLTTARQMVLEIRKPECQPLEMLRVLSAELPRGIILVDFAYDRGKAVVLKGRADSNTVLAAAMAAVARIGGFASVMLDYSTLVSKEVGTSYDFQITCTLPAASDQSPTKARRGTTRKGMVVR